MDRMGYFSLPQLEALYEPHFAPPSMVIVAGGRLPESSRMNELCKDRDVWAVDRGLDSCMEAGITPSLFIGDGDSVSKEARQWYLFKGIPSILFSPEKDLTDLQLALKEAGGAWGYPSETAKCSAILTGSFGGRFDHLFANIYSLILA